MGNDHLNNGPTFSEIDGDLMVAVNSIQRTLFVERLCVNIHAPANRIIPYDLDNLYPNKIKAIALRSGSTKSAVKTLSGFSSGNGFQGMDLVVNRDGQTLWDILRFISSQKALFEGYALHFNYNMFGQIAEINPVNFEFVRWSKDLKSYTVNEDWARRRNIREEIIYNPFNPSKAKEEIEVVGGLDKYNGQLFYWIPNKSDWYTVCTWDDVLDDAQLEAEVKLYSLSSVQNDYSLAGIISYPKHIEGEREKEKVKSELRGDKGSKNAGGIRVVSAMPTEGMQNWKWFTPISRNNIDGLHTNQIERAKFNIYASFSQPPILNGVSTDGMFNEASFADAFNYYNSKTETDRKEIERELNKILSASIWSNFNVEIQPKTYVTRESKQASDQGGAVLDKNGKPVEGSEINETLTNLTGRQLQGIFRITKRFKKGEITEGQATDLLKSGFNLNDEQVELWLINDDV